MPVEKRRRRRWTDGSGARQLKRETYALYLGANDPRAPWYVKALSRSTPARIATAAIVLCRLLPLALVGLFTFRALAG
jgi:hypothetical protein